MTTQSTTQLQTKSITQSAQLPMTSDAQSETQANGYKSPDTELKFLEELVREDTGYSNTFKITKGAFNKAMTYAKAIGQLAGTGMECYGYLLKSADSLDNIVTDIFLAPNQTNQSAYVRVSAEGVYQSSQEIEPKGLMIVGWWHSHGTFNTFHSGTDVRNFEVVLHSIAPRTMYKNERGQYTYNSETKELLVHGTKIKGIELKDDSQLEIVRKVEQDPYAYSMVVNMFRSYYLEKISKTLISRTDGYELNRPVKPTLELVTIGNDVKYTISEIEDDITSKVEIHGGFNDYFNEDFNDYVNSGYKKSGFNKSSHSDLKYNNFKSNKKNSSKSNNYHGDKRNPYSRYDEKSEKDIPLKNSEISKFVDGLKEDIPQYLIGFIDGIINKEKSLLSNLDMNNEKSGTNIDLSASPSDSQANDVPISDTRIIDAPKKVDLEKLAEILELRFENVAEKYILNKAYDIKRLREELAYHFITDYSNAHSGKSIESINASKNLEDSLNIVKRYTKIDSNLSNNFDISINAGKALAKYSMERFTDYNNECNHKYKNFIGHFLQNLNTVDYMPISSSIKQSRNARYDKATEKLFLYNERLKIVNNILTTLTFRSEEFKFKYFLTDFAAEYQNNPASEKLDSIIEEKLLSVFGVNDFSSYSDRISYEHKGVLGKIFGEVKNYFGGAKNVG